MSISLQQYLSYLQYLAVSLGMTALFAAVYLRITPADELKLIKNGNLACALSFGGALVGFCLPLASSIAHSVGLLDFVLWSWAAAAILAGNNVAVGTLCAVISVAVGLLNAACLV